MVISSDKVVSFCAMHYPYGGNCPFLNLLSVKDALDVYSMMFSYLIKRSIPSFSFMYQILSSYRLRNNKQNNQ